MRKNIKILSLLFIYSVFYTNCVFAEIDCHEKATAVEKTYFQNNYARQISSQKIDSLDAGKQKEAKIRNSCFSASIDWHYLCEYMKCRNFLDTDEGPDGTTLSQLCTWKDMDCFSEDIEKVFSVLRDSHDFLFDLAFADMNEITKSIKNNEETTIQIDLDNSRCYKTDTNGDTVWHAFAKNKKLYWWDSTCVSYLRDTHLNELAEAMYKTKNKDGKTALQIMLDWDSNTNLLSALSEVYGEKGGRKACDELASDISNTNGIDISQVKPLINRCYIFAYRK